jgi:hypothetical protein
VFNFYEPKVVEVAQRAIRRLETAITGQGSPALPMARHPRILCLTSKVDIHRQEIAISWASFSDNGNESLAALYLSVIARRATTDERRSQ